MPPGTSCKISQGSATEEVNYAKELDIKVKFAGKGTWRRRENRSWLWHGQQKVTATELGERERDKEDKQKVQTRRKSSPFSIIILLLFLIIRRLD